MIALYSLVFGLLIDSCAGEVDWCFHKQSTGADQGRQWLFFWGHDVPFSKKNCSCRQPILKPLTYKCINEDNDETMTRPCPGNRASSFYHCLSFYICSSKTLVFCLIDAFCLIERRFGYNVYVVGALFEISCAVPNNLAPSKEILDPLLICISISDLYFNFGNIVIREASLFLVVNFTAKDKYSSNILYARIRRPPVW